MGHRAVGDMADREHNASHERWTLAAAFTLSLGCGGMAGDVSADVGEATRSQTVEANISASGDDAAESAGGAVSLSSTRLEIVQSDAQRTGIVGLRFAQLAVPQGATVLNATLELTVDEVSAGAASVSVRAEAADDAQPFVDTPGSLSARSLTAAAVAWEPGAWLQVGARQRTADLAPLIQEVVNRPGWSEGSALALMASGQGQRSARSFDADPAAAPSLSVSFAVVGGPCLSGQLRCTGSVLERCVASGSGFELMAIFVTPELCEEAQSVAQCIPEEGGDCAPGDRGNGQACGNNAQCASGNCVDGVCCDGACDAPCETCAGTGVCRAATTDPVCGSVACSSFDAACVSNTADTSNVCLSRGQCRTVADCGFRSATTRCEQGGLCDGQGTCVGPSVQCGTQTCSDGDVCCSRLDFATGQRTLACGVGSTCNLPGAGTGPTVRISCDQHADCSGNEVCCLVTNNVSSGELSCRQTCTAQAVGLELGAPPAQLVVGQICGSPAGTIFLQCPSGQSCGDAVSTLPPQFDLCR